MAKTLLFIAGLLVAAAGFYLANRERPGPPAADAGVVRPAADAPANISLDTARATALGLHPGELISEIFKRAPGDGD